MRPEPFKSWTRPLRLKRHLGRFLPSIPVRSSLSLQSGKGGWADVELRRQGRSIVLSLPGLEDLHDDRINFCYRAHLPSPLYLFARMPMLGEVRANLQDGGEDGAVMLFSGNHPDAILIPDPEFFNSHGYASQRLQLASQRPWRERSDAIVWRGATTGAGRQLDDSLDPAAPDILPRIRLCGLLKDVPGVDAKIHRVVQADRPDDAEDALRRAGLWGEPVAPDAWLDQKFAIDIDGNTNAWSNLFTRLLFGCCVIKVGSPRGFRQWYYDRLIPWTHYVPVRPDMADLLEQVAWRRDNPEACADIAAAGQALALSMTLESEMQGAVARLGGRLS